MCNICVSWFLTLADLLPSVLSPVVCMYVLGSLGTPCCHAGEDPDAAAPSFGLHPQSWCPHFLSEHVGLAEQSWNAVEPGDPVCPE
uniref:Secreted protein n=2 Tax=Pan TaxID=9596 RepID=A0A2I3SVW7_PANTR